VPGTPAVTSPEREGDCRIDGEPERGTACDVKRQAGTDIDPCQAHEGPGPAHVGRGRAGDRAADVSRPFAFSPGTYGTLGPRA
jgi:hypothetical protein